MTVALSGVGAGAGAGASAGAGAGADAGANAAARGGVGARTEACLAPRGGSHPRRAACQPRALRRRRGFELWGRKWANQVPRVPRVPGVVGSTASLGGPRHCSEAAGEARALRGEQTMSRGESDSQSLAGSVPTTRRDCRRPNSQSNANFVQI